MMPSSLSHAMMAVAAGSMIAPRTHLRTFLALSAACAVLPDIDAIGRLLPIDDGDIESLGGHRGFTHSLTFAALMGVTAATLTLARSSCHGHRTRLMLFITSATAAHGALDALTSIGATTSPVQFFGPFSSYGYTLASPPIHGPFGELFLCLLPLCLITRCVWHVRDLPRPKRQRLEEPLTIRTEVVARFGTTRDGAARFRKWIYVALLVLLAFLGWRAESRLAEVRARNAALSLR